jgi:ketosteroid isomerase-like protein
MSTSRKSNGPIGSGGPTAESEARMSELEEFLNTFLPMQIEADTALHNGDAEPRLALWSRNDPVTILGALGVVSVGWDEVEETCRWIASRFSNCTRFDFELLAAGVSGDLAYTAGYEHSEFSIDGGPPRAGRLRATHAYRREGGEWKIMHRHGDPLASDGG